MNNRLLSLLVLLTVFGGLFGAYYYFFVSGTGTLSLITNGSGTTFITLTSEFGKSITKECEKNCLFENIPAVNYTVSAKREEYAPLTKTFKLERGETKKVLLAMEREVALTEQKKKKEETIRSIKLKKDIQDTLETHTGAIILGYQSESIYYALPETSPLPPLLKGEGNTWWSIFVKKEGVESQELFKIPEGKLTDESLDIYDGFIALERKNGVYFYSLENGQERTFSAPGNILGVKDTRDPNTKILTSDAGVFLYTLSEKVTRKNPLYDDIVELPSGEIVALVKKSSREKRSLLSVTDTGNDLVFLIGQDTRERKTLLKTPKNGKLLRYKNGEILFVEEWGEVLVINNVK